MTATIALKREGIETSDMKTQIKGISGRRVSVSGMDTKLGLTMLAGEIVASKMRLGAIWRLGISTQRIDFRWHY